MSFPSPVHVAPTLVIGSGGAAYINLSLMYPSSPLSWTALLKGSGADLHFDAQLVVSCSRPSVFGRKVKQCFAYYCHFEEEHDEGVQTHYGGRFHGSALSECLSFFVFACIRPPQPIRSIIACLCSFCRQGCVALKSSWLGVLSHTHLSAFALVVLHAVLVHQ